MVAGFDNGLNVEVSDTHAVDGVRPPARAQSAGSSRRSHKLRGHGNPAMVASAVEFILEGLHLNKRLNKDEVKGQTRYRATGQRACVVDARLEAGVRVGLKSRDATASPDNQLGAENPGAIPCLTDFVRASRSATHAGTARSVWMIWTPRASSTRSRMTICATATCAARWNA